MEPPILRTTRNGASPIAPAEGAHTYAKPGRYMVKLRCVQNGSLSDFRFSTMVSRALKLGDPLIVRPHQFNFDTAAKTLTITTAALFNRVGAFSGGWAL